jgi:uncharacterized protein YkwD
VRLADGSFTLAAVVSPIHRLPRPGRCRRLLAAILAATALAVPTSAHAGLGPNGAPLARHAARSSAYASNLLREINRARRLSGLHAVQLDAQLLAVARRFSSTLAVRGVLSHVSPDGSAPQQRVAASGFDGDFIGEDLAVGLDPAACVASWLLSPPHRHVLLSPDVRVIGIGVAAGLFGAESADFVTADFGR